MSPRSAALVLALLVSPLALGEAAPAPEGNLPREPYRIAGNLYYVGASDIASYLVTTPEGYMLVNPGYEETVPIIRANVKTLGLGLADVRVILNSQAHWDHVAGCAELRRETNAKVMAAIGDADVMEGGGKADFRYDGIVSFPPCKVDRVLRDGDEVRLGDVVLHAVLTPGHTKGCTTWTFDVEDGGKRYTVVIVGGTAINDGVVLLGNARYPGIVADYEKTFRTLSSLKPDIFLGAHASYYDGEAKAKRRGEGRNPFVDPEGYRAYVERAQKAYESQLARERAAAARP